MSHHKKRTLDQNVYWFCVFVLFCHFKHYVFLLLADENILNARHEFYLFYSFLLLFSFTHIYVPQDHKGKWEGYF